MARAMLTVLQRRSSGFTLTEVLLVVAILAVLAGIAVPSMRDLMASSRLRGASSDLYGGLILARSEAIKRNGNVDVIPTDASNWGAGWTVRIASTAENLTVREALTSDLTFAGPASSLRYRGDGRLIDPSTGSLFAAEVPFTVYATQFAHVAMRCIDVHPSGRPVLKTDRDRNTANGCNG